MLLSTGFEVDFLHQDRRTKNWFLEFPQFRWVIYSSLPPADVCQLRYLTTLLAKLPIAMSKNKREPAIRVKFALNERFPTAIRAWDLTNQICKVRSTQAQNSANMVIRLWNEVSFRVLFTAFFILLEYSLRRLSNNFRMHFTQRKKLRKSRFYLAHPGKNNKLLICKGMW